MNPRTQRVSQALADAGQSDPQKDPPQTETKKRSPVPSPEFAAARALRDMRMLDERERNLEATYKEKREEIAAKRRMIAVGLTDAAKDVLSKMLTATRGEASGG